MLKYIICTAGLTLGMFCLAATAAGFPPPPYFDCKKVAVDVGPNGAGRVEHWRCGAKTLIA